MSDGRSELGVDSRFRGNDGWGAGSGAGVVGPDGGTAACAAAASSLACLPKPRVRSSLAADMRWWGLKALRSPSITLMRKRQTERPSSVDSRMTFASALSNSVSLEEPESDLRREGSGGLFRMKAFPSSSSYLTRSFAASSL